MGEDNLIRPADFTREREKIGVNWRVREGLHGLVGRLRIPGTALIVEDVCVPPARIAEAAKDIQALLGEHGFLTGVAGHTSAGNLHFMLTPDFAKQEDLDRYEAFMEGLVALVCDKYDGSLKAEHGTGVNMAPYVAREWGEQATELMWRVKRLADPDGVLGPGVVMNDDPAVHLQNLKTTPEVEEVVNTCVECGFCEPACPSQDLTTTPAPAHRASPRDGAPGRGLARWRRCCAEEFEYDGLETCAADGSCVLACPLSIDTGKLVKELRAKEHSGREEKLALRAAKSWSKVERSSRAGLRAGPIAERIGGGDLPRAAQPLPGSTRREGAAAVYFPSCTNRIMGASKKARPGPSLADATVAVSERAGMPVWIPPDVGGSCCGVPWSSKGHREGHAWMARQTFEKLWALVGRGRASGRERRVLLHARPDVRDARRSPRGRPGAAREARDPRLGRVGRAPLAEARTSSGSSGAWRSIRPARPAISAWPRDFRASRRRWPTRSPCPPRPAAAASRATAGCSTRS